MHRPVRPDHRNAEVRGVAGGEHRVRVSDPSVVPDVGDRTCGARLHDVADEPRGRGRARPDRLTFPLAGGGAPDDLVALEQPNRGAAGLEQLDGRAYGDVEQVVRVELTGELDAGPRQPLRKRTGTPLALVQLAPLERAAGGTRDVARELELLVPEHGLAAEEDDHEREAPHRRAGREGSRAASRNLPSAAAFARPEAKRLSSLSRRDASTFPARACAVRAPASVRR